MASSVSGQANMSKSFAVIGYPSWQGDAILPAVSRKKHFPVSHIINPLLTKLVRPTWLDIGLFLFCVVMELDSVSLHKHAKKETTWPISSHLDLTSLINNPYVSDLKT